MASVHCLVMTLQVNTYTSSNQRYSDIDATSDGGFIITWTSNGQGESTSYANVYAQRYDANGEKLGGEIRANNWQTSYNQESSKIAVLSDDSFVITYRDTNWQLSQ